jgi:hypothetical protein
MAAAASHDEHAEGLCTSIRGAGEEDDGTEAEGEQGEEQFHGWERAAIAAWKERRVEGKIAGGSHPDSKAAQASPAAFTTASATSAGMTLVMQS